jgi:hypothetical protein
MYAAQQSGFSPFANAGFGNAGFGFPGQGFSLGGGFGSDPMGSNAQMMALGQQQQMMSTMMSQMMSVMSLLMSTMLLRQMQSMASSLPGFGGSGSGGASGLGNFLGGGGAGGGGAVSAPSAPTAGSSDFGSGTQWGRDLAKDAQEHANGPGGYCYKWVAQALARHGVSVHGASAYMAADQLAKNPKFREIKVEPKDLPKLPAGAIVVWNKGSGHEHGHISIALGNGKEASDMLRQQITNYGTTARVFLPK